MRALRLSMAALLLGACLPERDLSGVACEPATGCEPPWACVESAGRFVCLLGAPMDASVDGGSDAGLADAGGTDAGALDAGGPDAGVDGGSDAGVDAGSDAGLDAGARDAGVVATAQGERLVVTDLSANGGFDLLFSEPGSGRISFWRAPQAFPAQATEEFTVTLASGGIHEVVPVDLTGSAALELLVFPVDGGAPVLLTRVGNTWAESLWSPLPEAVVAGTAVDIDGDSRAELVLSTRGTSTVSVDLYRPATDGGVTFWANLVTYPQSAEVRGVRHAVVPGGTLVVDFGTLGFRSRVVDGSGGTSRSVNHSGDLLELHRIASSDPRRLFLAVSANRGLVHHNLNPDASVDLDLVMLGTAPNGLVQVDAGTTSQLCMGDFRHSPGALAPSLVVAGAQVLSYPYAQRVTTGSFPGERWQQTPQQVAPGPVVGAALAARTAGAAVDLYLVTAGNPRTLTRVGGF